MNLNGTEGLYREALCKANLILAGKRGSRAFPSVNSRNPPTKSRAFRPPHNRLIKGGELL